jgi:hypothetical protein
VGVFGRLGKVLTDIFLIVAGLVIGQRLMLFAASETFPGR